MKGKLKIQMLGPLKLEYGKKHLSAEGHQTEKPWIMLAYLLQKRGEAVGATELYKAIEGKNPENDPARAMKNQLYRLRKMLDQLGFVSGSHMVLYNQGEYMWNQDLECEIDLDFFWSWIDKAEKARSMGQKSHYFRNALRYYQGELLSEFCYYPWIAEESGWIETAFLKASEVVIMKLEENKEWDEINQLCTQLMDCSPDSFFLKEHYLRALVAQEKNDEALRFAFALQEDWERDYGVSIGEVWPELYHLLGAEEKARYLDMDYLQSRIMEDNPAKGAFFAEFGVFRSAYQLMMRTADRYKLNTWLCQLSIRNLGYENTEEGFEKEKIHVCELLRHTLRKGDLATGYCPGEYLLLLTVEQEYDLPRIFRRIADRCRMKKESVTISVQYERVTRIIEESIRKWTMKNG